MIEGNPFDFAMSKSGIVQITHKGKVVMTLKGRAAAKFADRASRCDAEALQLLMAKTTGQFKFGNEKNSKKR